MSDFIQQAKARAIRGQMEREGTMPAALRAPLDAVIESSEIPGTAYDVLVAAFEAAGYRKPRAAAASTERDQQQALKLD